MVLAQASSLRGQGFAQTRRRDRWWLEPISIFTGLSAFVVYATWAAFQGEHYYFGSYLSPFYSPEIFGLSEHSLFGPPPAFWPAWLPFSPALLILWAPGGFRVTCYYYRGSYYKAFWADPPSCAVGEPRTHYRGENSFPLIIQNIHRYFLFLAVIFLFFLASDVWKALFFTDANGAEVFGLGVGTIVLAINVVLLGGYALGCHSRRRQGSNRQGAPGSTRLRLLELSQSQSHEVGLGKPVLGRLLGPVRAVVLDGHSDGLENPLMPDYQSFEYDVVVIGAGGAGLRAAIEASASGARVGLICKSLLGKAHTVMAEGGMAASLGTVNEDDGWDVHFADTMRGGQYLNNWKMAELHAREAPECVRELEAWGAVFDRTSDGRILQRNFGGHKYPRLAHVGDRTGLEMIRTLQDHGIHQGIDVHMEVTVVSLMQDDGRVAGAFGFDRQRGRFMLFGARAVVLATGGIGRAYRITSNSWEYTGDGHSLAYRAGADLKDMEFVQFHPTGMVWPPSVAGILVTEGVRGEGGVLRNSEGRRFMFDDIPEAYKNQTADNEPEGWEYTQGKKTARRPPELLTRDHVARCIVREIKEGRGSPHGGVYLDIAWIREKLPNSAEHIKRKLPSMYHQFKQLAGIDITEVPMEVGPTTHYVMGGIAVDAESQMSTVPGLFAAGECATGLHGANRLGGNSLSDLLVFGRRAGRFAAQFARENGAGKIDTNEVDQAAAAALAPFDRNGGTGAGEGPYQIQSDLQSMMQEMVGIVRNETDLQSALQELEVLTARARKVSVDGNREYNTGWHTALDLPNLLVVSEAIARSALVRTESRGGHFREDYPARDPAFGNRNTIVRRGPDGEMQVVESEIPELPAELKQVIEDQR
jgi:succinate dehydrogenase / fumarate reductase flavoprotein subunit